MGSPGSRVRCFRTCTRSQTAQGPNAPRYCGSPGIAFRRGNNVSTLKLSDISRLNTRPARTSVNASPKPLQIPAHDSRPVWIATPSPYDSFIHDILPVLTGASATIWNLARFHIDTDYFLFRRIVPWSRYLATIWNPENLRFIFDV